MVHFLSASIDFSLTLSVFSGGWNFDHSIGAAWRFHPLPGAGQELVVRPSHHLRHEAHPGLPCHLSLPEWHQASGECTLSTWIWPWGFPVVVCKSFVMVCGWVAGWLSIQHIKNVNVCAFWGLSVCVCVCWGGGGGDWREWDGERFYVFISLLVKLMCQGLGWRKGLFFYACIFMYNCEIRFDLWTL